MINRRNLLQGMAVGVGAALGSPLLTSDALAASPAKTSVASTQTGSPPAGDLFSAKSGV